LWRTGLDLSRPDEAAWQALGPLLTDFTQLSFALPEFVPSGIGGPRLRVVPGAFDPLAAAQRGPGPRAVARRVRRLGIDPSRPLAVDVTRLDRWADPLAAVEAWRRARAEAGGLQLALTGRLDRGDREAATVVDEVRAFAGEDLDLHILADRPSVDDFDRGALVRLARCATLTALGDEFDPGLSAVHWHGTAAIADGAAARAQIADGEDGYLAPSIDDRAARIARLAGDPGQAVAMGRAGREHARGHFLLTRLLGDELATIGSILGARAAVEERPRVTA
jgi:trehalose synthase